METEESFDGLEQYVRERFGEVKIEYRWSGQVIEPADGLPYIGPKPYSKRIHVATGFSGNGMTWGTFSSMLIRDLIVGRENPFASTFDPSRIRLRASASQLIQENLDSTLCFIKDRITPPDDLRPEELDPGEGRIIHLEGKRLAAYKSPSGELRTLSPVCPHLGCMVRFNSAEQSWDCPCHGSRFSVEGKVLHGPARGGLRNVPYEPAPPEGLEKRKKKAG